VQVRRGYRWQRSLFLQASQLLTRSLDYDTVVHSIARVAIPHLADWVSVYVPGDGALAPRLVVAHRSRTQEALLSRIWQNWHRHLPETHPHVQSFQSGSALTLSGDAVSALAISPVDCPHEAATLERVGLQTIVTLPLIAHGVILGSIMLVNSRPSVLTADGEQFHEIASNLVTCAAQVLHNARLFREANLAVRLRDENIAVATHTLSELLSRVREHSEGIREQGAVGSARGQVQLKRGLAQIELLVREMEHIIRELQSAPGLGALC
jgi:GAF domain